MDDTKYLDLIAKQLSGNIIAEERRMLDEWIAQSEAKRRFFEEMIHLWSISSDYEEKFEADIPAAWTDLDRKITQLEQNKGGGGGALMKDLGRFPWLMRAAAAVLLLLAIGYWGAGYLPFGARTVAVQTGEEEKKTISLPDGSLVWLNENTLLSYNKDFRKRIVDLEGEAFFEVEKLNGRPFEINSGDARTVVLGTAFNIRAYPREENIEVTVESGIVKLEETIRKEEVLLEADHSGIYDKKTREISKKIKKIPNASSWKTQQLAFDDVLLIEVISALERYYEVNIGVAAESILNCHFKLDPVRNPQLEEILAMIEFSMNLKISRKGNTFLISGQGCE